MAEPTLGSALKALGFRPGLDFELVDALDGAGARLTWKGAAAPPAAQAVADKLSELKASPPARAKTVAERLAAIEGDVATLKGVGR